MERPCWYCHDRIRAVVYLFDGARADLSSPQRDVVIDADGDHPGRAAPTGTSPAG